MILPLGSLGVFSIGLEQKFFANNRLELLDETSNIRLTSRVGIYEFLPSYSIRLPFFLSDFAVGTSYRVLFGNSFSTLERGPLDWGDEAWMARNIIVTERERGYFESTSDWWKNFGYSLHYHKKTVDYFISYFPSIQMQQNIRKNIQFEREDRLGIPDTLQTHERKEFFKLPNRFAHGVHFRFLQNKNLSLVHEQQRYDDPISSYFAEYKISGTGLHYSPFFKRNDFGISAWYAEKYVKDINEYGASLFSDLWLGRRGTLIGIAFFGGYRQAKEPHWDEPFFGLRLNLTGVGNWGTSVRRR
jgi:long-chain fatty acid transport protein